MFSKDGNQHDLTILEPPNPIKRNFYRCDAVFHTDSIIPLYQTHEDYYTVLYIKGQCATYFKYWPGLCQMDKVKQYQTKLQNNHSMGGQSQNRIMRLRENGIHEYLKTIAEGLGKYIDDQCLGLIIAGHGTKPQQFRQYLNKAQISLLQDTIVTDNLTKEQVQDIVKTRDQSVTRGQLQDLETLIATDPDRLAFGEEEVTVLLQEGMLSHIYDIQDNAERRKLSSDMGCTYIVIPHLQYRLCGVRWY